MATHNPGERTGLRGWSRARWTVIGIVLIAIVVVALLLVAYGGGGGGGGGGGY